MTSEEVCQYLTEVLPVPVISLGAGNKAHGVHIITSDLFHLYEEHVPRHSKIYTDLIPIMEDVFVRYRDEVKARIYPGAGAYGVYETGRIGRVCQTGELAIQACAGLSNWHC